MGWSSIVANARLRRQQQIAGSGGAAAPDYTTAGGVQAEQDRRITQQTGYGDRGTEDYLSRAENFDASTALNKYAEGAWGDISSALGENLKDYAGQAVGQGRFDSGFYDEGKGVIVNRATQQFSNALAGQSMNALAAQQRNTESLGSFASDRTGMGNDLFMSRSEQVQNDARAEAERQRRKKGGLLSGIGTAIGYGLGGPVGGMVGGAIGSYAGG